MRMLLARLEVLAEEENDARAAEARGAAVRASWGEQVRNYVLAPYKLGKDLRTGVETSDVQDVLDGGASLDGFVDAFLSWSAAERAAAQQNKEPIF